MKFLHTYILIVICFLMVACNEDHSINQQKQIKSTPNTTIFWMDSIINLGKVKMGDTISFSFRFKNIGRNSLIVNNIESSCSCTSVQMLQKIVAQNDTASIDAVFDTRKSITGFIRKSIDISTNTIPAKKKLIYYMEITGHKTSTGSH